MRLLMVSHAAEKTGAPISFLALANIFAKTKKIEIKIVSRRPGPLVTCFEEIADTFVFRYPASFSLLDAAITAQRGVPILAVKCYRNPERPYCLSRDDRNHVGMIRDQIQRWKPDVIYANTTHCADVLQELACSAPVLMHVREMADVLGNLDKRCQKYAQNEVRGFLAASEATKADLIRFWDIPAERISVEPPAIDTRIFRDLDVDALPNDQDLPFDLAPTDLLIVGAGTVDRRKGADLFYEVAKRVLGRCNDRPMPHFLWLGDGEMRLELIERCRISGLQANLRFPGAVDNPHPLLRRANLVLMTSREDPYPRVMIEAAAHGTPVICFENSGGAPGFIREFEAGQVVAGFCPQAMAAAVQDFDWATSDNNDALASKVRFAHDVENSAPRILDHLSSLCTSQE